MKISANTWGRTTTESALTGMLQPELKCAQWDWSDGASSVSQGSYMLAVGLVAGSCIVIVIIAMHYRACGHGTCVGLANCNLAVQYAETHDPAPEDSSEPMR